MNNISEYISEKLHLTTDAIKKTKSYKSKDAHKEMSYDEWEKYLDTAGLECSIESDKDSIFSIRISLKGTDSPSVLAIIPLPQKSYFILSSLRLGKYQGKLKKSMFNPSWWRNRYDLIYTDSKYFFTKNNAHTLASKLQMVIDKANE